MELMERQETYVVPEVKILGRMPMAFVRFYDLICSVSHLGKGFRDDVIAAAGLSGNESVLDIGFGTGALLADIASAYPGVVLHGVEPERRLISLTETRIRSARPDAAFSLARSSAQELPFADGSFDVCFLSLVLHHCSTEGKRSAMREAFRVLKPGGRAVVADFGKTGYPSIARFFPFERYEFLRGNFEGEVEHSIAEAGFRSLSVRHRKGGVFVDIKVAIK